MSSIFKRPNGQWRARYRDEGGKEHARHFARKTDAQQWLNQVTASVVRGDYVDPRAGRITVSGYAASWETAQVSSVGTKRIVDNALRLHLLPVLGTMPIGTIRPTTIQGFVKGLEDKHLSPGTVRNVYDVTARLFASAVDDRVIAHSPCRKIRLPRSDGEEVSIPGVDGVAAIAEAIGPRWRAMVVTLAGSGLRIGELRALQVADVDFLRRTISVTKQRTQANVTTPLKSKASRRVVPVGQIVIDELAAHLAAYPSSGPLFTDEMGAPVGYGRWKNLVTAAVAEVNASRAEAADERGEVAQVLTVTAHSFRHFAASALIAGGASVKQVQMFLGHASAVITLRTYSHLWPGDEDRTRNVLDAALSPLADSLRTEAAPKHITAGQRPAR